MTFFEEKKFLGEKIIFRKFWVRPLIFFRHLNIFSKNIFFRTSPYSTRMSVLHPHVHISSTRKSAPSTRMCVLMTKYLFYPHVCVLPACVDHTLAPCAVALLPIFFSTPYRSHARNFITNLNFCTPFSLLDSYLNPPSNRPPIARYIFNR